MDSTQIPTVSIFSIGYDSAVNHLQRFIHNDTHSVREIIPIVFMFACFWHVIFYILKKVIRKLVHNKPWLIEALERHYERGEKKTLADLKIHVTKEEALQRSMDNWPYLQCIYIQHLIGSLFVIPSLLGIGDPQVTSSLACLGVLSEMGWEVQDTAEMFYIRNFYEDGKKIKPDAIVFIFLLHHSMTTVLGVPMIVYYHTNRALHWLCFDLQFAAFVALALSEYTNVLDINKPNELWRFKIANFISLVVMIWTRVFHWSYLCVELFITWYNDRAWAFLFIGVILSVAFTMFNYLIVTPMCKKNIKFLHVSAEHENLPSDASTEVQRASSINLEQAVIELLEDNGVKSLFINRQVSRRHTATFSAIKVYSHQMASRKRHSAMITKEFAERLKNM